MYLTDPVSKIKPPKKTWLSWTPGRVMAFNSALSRATNIAAKMTIAGIALFLFLWLNQNGYIKEYKDYAVNTLWPAILQRADQIQGQIYDSRYTVDDYDRESQR